MLSCRGRVVATYRNTVITTTIREALTSGLRSLAGYFDRSDADTAVISIEWQGPADQRPPRNPPYEVTIALPPREESAR